MMAGDENVRVLMEENSPNGYLTAVLEESRGVVYLYIVGARETFGMRGVWVRNLRAAPAEFETQVVKNGLPPLLPASACAHPAGATPIDLEKVRIVWFEGGDGAAMFEGDELLAVAPGWSGDDGYRAYARDCVQENPLCSPLTNAPQIVQRVREAERFWKSWEKGHWGELQPKFLSAYERAFGKEKQYFAIDGGKWPPKALARFETDEAIVLATLGVSIQPQPGVEMVLKDPKSARRIEFGFAFERASVDEAALELAAQYVSAQSNLPWYAFTWVGHGHTIDCDPCPAGREFSSVMLVKDSKIEMPEYRGEPVNLLWMLPITPHEREVAERDGSEEVIEKLRGAGVTWMHRKRST
jgi:hypothetical protein